MRRSRKPIVIASRPSRLARIQAQRVGKALGRLHPNIAIEYRWIESEGDQDADAPLADRGGKGLFTRKIERAVLNRQADLAVHSLKDLPAQNTAGLSIAAVPQRGDVRDCLICRDGAAPIDALHEGDVVGTSSPRRAAQLLRLRPDVRIEPIRGNVETRLSKVLEPDGVTGRAYDATLVASAALRRLGLTEHTTHAIEFDQMLPASCQGAIAIQCRVDDHVTLTRCLPLNDPATSTAVHAERQVVSALLADCNAPLAVLAEPVKIDAATVKRNADAHWFGLRVRVLSSDGCECLEAADKIKTVDLRRLVKRLVKDLTDRGARRILQSSHGLPVQSRSLDHAKTAW